MKHIPAWRLAASAALFSMLACSVMLDGGSEGSTVRGSGTVVSQDRNVGSISEVELAMPGTLHITMGDNASLRVEAEDNLQAYIRTDVIADRLVIETTPGIRLQSTRPIDYFLTVQKLSAIAISSSGSIQADDLQSTSFAATISSSGNASISRLTADSISVRISSSGELEILGGQVRDQTISLSSSGEYRARDLASAQAEVNLTSSGNATIRVSELLTGRLTSSGDLYYTGNPAVSVSLTSSGRAVQLDE